MSGEPGSRRLYRASKRAFDIAACILVLPLVLPLLGACALAIRLESPGPIVFVQHRTGQHGRRFRLYKFRTMVQDADERKEQLRHLSIVPWPDFKVIDDPRITRVGRFLRRTSLDEMPQILNVLRGDMSLVGPRPTSFAASTYSLWHTERLEVIPGITGLWQVKGRNSADFDERLRMDVEYMAHASLLYDIRLLFLTVAAVTGRKGR